jgi:colicin import membrane protein
MGPGSQDAAATSFRGGYLVSFSVHSFFALWMLFGPGSSASTIIAPTEVYTITIEGGEKMGGISQVPISQPKNKVLPNIQEPLPVQEKVVQEKTKDLVKPSIIEEQKLLEEKKVKEQKAAEEKKAEEKKIAELKLAEKKLEEKKLKEELAKAEKQKAEDEKKKKEKEKKERDARLEKAIKNATNYTGESANAGGQGLGAARLGGKGMGGGTPASMEFILYRNALEQHIKGGWRWPPTADRYQAQIDFTILPDGSVQNVRVSATSGNSSFDDSALRAVYKASPVPIPPEDLYDQFKRARMTFDSDQ